MKRSQSKGENKKGQFNQSHQQIWQQIQQLEKYIHNQSISSISLANEDYYATNKKHKRRYNQPPCSEQEMVIVPKYKLLRLFQEIKTLKKIIKSRQKKISDEIESLRKGVRQINGERVLLMRQQQYLKDMKRAASESKLQYYRSSPNFYKVQQQR